MAEDALKIRRSAKTRFTRKKNEFFKAIAEKKGTEILKRKFDELTDAWSTVEGKHDIYLMYLNEEEITANEKWIEQLQEEYNEASTVYIKYDNERKALELKEQEELNRQHIITLREEEFQRIVQQTIMKKKSTEAIFESLIEHVKNIIESDVESKNTMMALRKTEKDIELALTDCKSAHAKMLEISNGTSAENEIEWIRKIQTRYNETIERIETFTATIEDEKKTKQSSPLRLEKVKMPFFDGTIRQYPQFKQDFQKQVMPTVNKESACYILRSCLGKEANDTVKSIDDDIQEMWKRLDEKYGDPAKVADAIINTIQNVRPIKEGENKKFIELVDAVEDGYNDLKKLGLEREITTTSSVSIIERKLPPEIRKEWAKLVSADNSTVDKTNKFPSLLSFLLSQKRAIEYDIAELRVTNNPTVKGSVHYTNTSKKTEEGSSGHTYQSYSKCLLHKEADHWTSECKLYLSKPIEEKMKLLKENGACWSCLRKGHRSLKCRKKKRCGVNECTKWHHKTLHQDDQLDKPTEDASGSASLCSNSMIDSCLLQLQKIPTKHGWANVLWDSGASLCFITNSKARAEHLKGTKVELSVTKVGGNNEKITSNRYKLSLFDKQGQEVQVDVYGIDKITSEIQSVDIDGIIPLFNNISKEDILRPSGTVDVLIGYEYASYHPQNEQSSGHLVLLRNRFGRCIGGTHPTIREKSTSHQLHQIKVNTAIARIEDFYNIENLGIECRPRCGGCKCGRCSLGSKNFTIKEEKELKLIEDKLEYNEEEKRWISEYPWIRDPSELPDNKKAAMGMLISTEKRLAKNATHAEVYQKQIEDMVDREVARKLTLKELKEYKGPIHYISHHEVLKPDSKSTPVRIVFNSSARYMGHALNDYWAKGPHLLNDLLGILIRFRENKIALIGDIKKMYHTVKTKTIDQHTHRFLWRDMNIKRPPDTYVIQRVSFGDKPSGTIATVALRKTAEMGQHKYPKAAKVIEENTYMDDVIESVADKEQAKNLTQDIESLLNEGSFKMKEWIFTHDSKEPSKTLTIPTDVSSQTEKVLGVVWNPIKDDFEYKVQLRTTAKGKKKSRIQSNANKLGEIDADNPTKRIILSQVNSIYDPLGLAGPFTVRAKILLRQLWGMDEKLNWDDPIPDKYTRDWKQFCQDLLEMNDVKFKRCLMPENAIDDPILIIFSDGSSHAYGACAYYRWKLNNGQFKCRLILSKNRLAPIKRLSIDRIELCGAVLNSRLKAFLERHCRYKLQKCYHIVDSQIVHNMIQKESYGFNTFAATRVGEIQQNTNPDDWYWTESKNNIADWLTRGKKPNDLNSESIWQRGPDFLELPESEWPINKALTKEQLPDQVKVAYNITQTCQINNTDTLASRLNIERYSNFDKLLRVTARVLLLYQRTPKPSFKNAVKPLIPLDVTKAEHFWIMEAQRNMHADIKKGKYKRLCPRKNEQGIYMVGGRGERWIEMSHNKNEVILLPYDHRFSRLYAEHIHRQGHLGVLSTSSKIRTKFWIIKLLKMVKSIRYNCVICKKLDKRLSEQIMGKLPVERLKPSPAWSCTAIDLFGPFKIKDEVKKRTIGKTYGVIFNCLATRAVHVDLAADYSTEKFLMVLRRFVSIRGFPSKLYSDNGPQLVAANEELKNVVKGWNQEELKTFGVMEGFKWDFAPADAPWQNGVSEALVKSIKRAITAAISDHVLTFSELQTVCFEAANLVNERPIGRHPTSPHDGTYLCPNDLLLGRATSRVPSGPFRETSDFRRRFEFVQSIVSYFWKKWTRDYFPSLLIQPKWHTAQRNLREGDVVLIQDANQIRGQWKLGTVLKAFPGGDGRVRKVQVQYKNPKPGEAVNEYHGRGFVTVERAVNKLVVLIPKEEDKDTKN